MFVLGADSTDGGSVASVKGGSRAMPNVRFGEQSQAQRAVGGDCAASPAQAARCAT